MIEIKDAYKEIDNKQFMQEFLGHMIDNLEKEDLQKVYTFCIDEFYAKLHGSF